ncbi:glycoside hydrolase family 5 protein [Apiospora kogelbergensis]|uniref:Endoglucanase EG-II n=1 Tax=Apiospora kogelbergensis TaxID=1337665 RepID=A0AAW0QXV6_9PEZI
MLFHNFFLLGLASTIAQAKVQYLDANFKKGVAIAGGDFGCQIDGNCPIASAQLPSDGADQMKHFVGDLGMNMMRLPISWQFLVNNQLGGSLDANNVGKYDQMVQSCLKTGAHCMIDIHNFARWNGGVIGQGGPSDDQFVSLWSQLASKYAANDKVAFEIMNEPHDLDVGLWAQTCQKVVTAIRQAGAKSQMILLPGTNFDSAATLVSSGSAAALLDVKNPDGTTDNLVLDIHKYLDEDNSGTHKECVTDNVEAFKGVATFLRANGRKGLVSESGASSAASCLKAFCSQNNFINANSDVFVGFVGWAAGSFDASYVLGLTPSKQNGKYVDNQVMMQCVVAPWKNSNNTMVGGTPGPSRNNNTIALPPSAQKPVGGTSLSPSSTMVLPPSLLLPTATGNLVTIPLLTAAPTVVSKFSTRPIDSNTEMFITSPISGMTTMTRLFSATDAPPQMPSPTARPAAFSPLGGGSSPGLPKAPGSPGATGAPLASGATAGKFATAASYPLVCAGALFVALLL